MSNHLAVAHATEALRAVLDAPVNKIDPSAHAYALRPEEAIKKGPGVNIFLYSVEPNASLRNADAPTFDSGGGLQQRPRTALDLHYLLTFHGDDAKFLPQMILGAVVRALHTQPLLTKKALEDAIKPPGHALKQSDLAQAAEAVRFTRLPLTLDELSKLWAMFPQTPYALSMAWLASVVVIDAEIEATPAMPVRSRNVVVVPTLGPVIDRIASRKAGTTDEPQPQPIIAGHELHIFGSGFGALDLTRVRINDELITPSTVDDNLVTLELKNPPITSLAAGVMSVQVVREIDFGPPSGKHDAFASNMAAFVLAPVIVSASVVAGPDVKVELDPPLPADRNLVLLLNGTGPATTARRFAVKSVLGADQQVSVTGTPAGTYLVRVQVDGAESPLELDPNGHVIGPKVTVP